MEMCSKNGLHSVFRILCFSLLAKIHWLPGSVGSAIYFVISFVTLVKRGPISSSIFVRNFSELRSGKCILSFKKLPISLGVRQKNLRWKSVLSRLENKCYWVNLAQVRCQSSVVLWWWGCVVLQVPLGVPVPSPQRDVHRRSIQHHLPRRPPPPGSSLFLLYKLSSLTNNISITSWNNCGCNQIVGLFKNRVFCKKERTWWRGTYIQHIS